MHRGGPYRISICSLLVVAALGCGDSNDPGNDPSASEEAYLAS